MDFSKDPWDRSIVTLTLITMPQSVWILQTQKLILLMSLVGLLTVLLGPFLVPMIHSL